MQHLIAPTWRNQRLKPDEVWIGARKLLYSTWIRDRAFKLVVTLKRSPRGDDSNSMFLGECATPSAKRSIVRFQNCLLKTANKEKFACKVNTNQAIIWSTDIVPGKANLELGGHIHKGIQGAIPTRSHKQVMRSAMVVDRCYSRFFVE